MFSALYSMQVYICEISSHKQKRLPLGLLWNNAWKKKHFWSGFNS